MCDNNVANQILEVIPRGKRGVIQYSDGNGQLLGCANAYITCENGVANIYANNFIGSTSGGGASNLLEVTNLGNITTNTVIFNNTTTSQTNSGNIEIADAKSINYLGKVSISGVGTSVAIGKSAGATSQSSTAAIAMGESAGQSNQAASRISIGKFAGSTTQNAYSVAVGLYAGSTGQHANCVSIGSRAGETNQYLDSVAIGSLAGRISQNIYSIAVGTNAGGTGQYTNSVAVGYHAGRLNQHQNSVAIGYEAGEVTQNNYCIAVGSGSGKTAQYAESVAMGRSSGQTAQGTRSVALGYYAATTSQGGNSVAVGGEAGKTSQGTHAVAIGYRAGLANQANDSVIISGGSGTLNGSAAGFYAEPIRVATVVQSNKLCYDTSAKELLYESDVQWGLFYQPDAGTVSNVASDNQAVKVWDANLYALTAATTIAAHSKQIIDMTYFVSDFGVGDWDLGFVYSANSDGASQSTLLSTIVGREINGDNANYAQRGMRNNAFYVDGIPTDGNQYRIFPTINSSQSEDNGKVVICWGMFEFANAFCLIRGRPLPPTFRTVSGAPYIATANLTATASHSEGSNTPEKAIDGLFSTRWGNNGDSLGANGWLLITFNTIYALKGIQISFEAAFPNQYFVQTAPTTSSTTYTTRVTVNKTSLGPQDTVALNVNAGRVRILGSTMATSFNMSIFELKIKGNYVG